MLEWLVSVLLCFIEEEDVQGPQERKHGEVAEKSTIFIRVAPLCGAAIQCPPQVMADASFPVWSQKLATMAQ